MRLSGKRYFQLSLALPLTFPLLGYFFPQSVLMMILFTAATIGGIPYLLLAAGVLWWSRKHDEHALRRLSYILPLIYLPLLIIALFLWTSLSTGGLPAPERFGKSVLGFSAYTLVIGYGYVLLANLIYEIFYDRPSQAEIK